MESNHDKRARRLDAAKWRDFCDSWVDIGRASDRELSALQAQKFAPGPNTLRSVRRNPILMHALALALIGCGSNPCGGK